MIDPENDTSFFEEQMNDLFEGWLWFIAGLCLVATAFLLWSSYDA